MRERRGSRSRACGRLLLVHPIVGALDMRSHFRREGAAPRCAHACRSIRHPACGTPWTNGLVTKCSRAARRLSPKHQGGRLRRARTLQTGRRAGRAIRRRHLSADRLQPHRARGRTRSKGQLTAIGSRAPPARVEASTVNPRSRRRRRRAPGGGVGRAHSIGRRFLSGGRAGRGVFRHAGRRMRRRRRRAGRCWGRCVGCRVGRR
jgi:hypothetical protein